MNPWYFEIGIMCLLLLLAVGLLICIIQFVKHRIKKQSNKAITVSIVTDAFLLLTIIMYVSSHSTYYIYTDNGPIMPDHLKHYYYMEYDEWGVIYNVYEGCQPGG